jgi:phosphoribosyl 1,2-cyclic phosphodiesterase
MLKIRILGSGSGISDPLRFQSSILLSSDDGSIMLDCGEPAAYQLMRYKFELNQLHTVLISHMHSDHVTGIFQLMKNMQIEKRKKELTIIMPLEGHKGFLAFLDAIYLSDKVRHYPINLITPEGAPSIGNININYVSTSHLKSFAILSGNPGECNSFILNYDLADKPLRIVYSSDLNKPYNMNELLKYPTDLFIVELAHFSPDTLFAEIMDLELLPARILITHLGPNWTTKVDEIKATMPKEISNKTIIAEDGLEFSL